MKTSFLLFIALSIALISFSCSYDNPVSKDSGSGLTTDNSQTPSFRITMFIEQSVPPESFSIVSVEVNLTSFNWYGSNVPFTTEKGDNSEFNVYYTFEWNNCPDVANLAAAFFIKNAEGTIIHAKDITKTLGVATGSGHKEDMGATFLQANTSYQYQLILQIADEDSHNKK